MKDARQLNRVVTKLNNMLNNRFGVAIEYFTLEADRDVADRDVTDRDVADRDQDAIAPNTVRALETVRRNAGSPMILANDELLIPMRIDGSLVGATKVDKIKGLLPRDLGQIKDTIDLILTEVVAAQRKLELLDISERFVREGGPNVISLNDHRLAFKEMN